MNLEFPFSQRDEKAFKFSKNQSLFQALFETELPELRSKSLVAAVENTGFEPVTSCLQNRRSPG
jgi:hypothetical protein